MFLILKTEGSQKTASKFKMKPGSSYFIFQSPLQDLI